MRSSFVWNNNSCDCVTDVWVCVFSLPGREFSATAVLAQLQSKGMGRVVALPRELGSMELGAGASSPLHQEGWDFYPQSLIFMKEEIQSTFPRRVWLKAEQIFLRCQILHYPQAFPALKYFRSFYCPLKNSHFIKGESWKELCGCISHTLRSWRRSLPSAGRVINEYTLSSAYCIRSHSSCLEGKDSHSSHFPSWARWEAVLHMHSQSLSPVEPGEIENNSLKI